ncbi:MAG: DUF4055 domain-containing protein [Alphaproteobacteria bacterium]|nr:DUF4055 domain-containing protein [Alphaproteobacteria bacterium]
MPITDIHPAQAAALSGWARLRDCVAGEEAVKARRAEYLPRPGGQTERAYRAYLARAVWYGATERTLRGLVGAIFRHPPVVEAPKSLLARLDDLAPDGRPFETLALAVTRETALLGRHGLLVDRPAKGAGDPYLASYPAEAICDWQLGLREGRQRLVRLVLQEADETYRELLLDSAGHYRVRLWRRKGPRGTAYAIAEEHRPTRDGQPLEVIPFVFLGASNTGPAIEKPPLADLAGMNLAHYRNSADYEQSLFLTGQPTPWISGRLEARERPNAIGSGTIWYLPEGCQTGMLEFTGAGIEALRQAMLDKEARMVQLGARLLEAPKRAAETAEAVRLRGEAEASTLSVLAQSVGRGLTQALRHLAWWRGLDPTQETGGVTVRLNSDFVEARLSAPELQALVAAWQAGAISRRTLYDNLRDGEIVPPSRSFEEEQEMVQSQPLEEVAE